MDSSYNPILLRKKDSLDTIRVIGLGKKKAFFLVKYALFISKDGKLLTRSENHTLKRIKRSIKNDDIIDETLKRIYFGVDMETIRTEQREKVRKELISPCKSIIDKYIGETFKEKVPFIEHDLMVTLYESLCNAYYFSDPSLHPRITINLFRRTTYCYRYLRSKEFYESEFYDEIKDSITREIEVLRRNFPFV